MRLLVIEDESLVSQRIKSSCVSEGFVCHIAETGKDGLEMIKFYDYDALILDLVLPDIDGIEILRRVRSIKNGIPVLVLSGLSSTEDKVNCLKEGADDYLTKPFSRVELLARIYAIVRRTTGIYTSVKKIGPLEINFGQRIIKINGNEITLTNKEYAILELLAMKKGAILSKETFLNHIYGGLDEPELKIVDVFICKLRKKIADLSGGINLIETVWGRGYTLRDIDDEDENEENHHQKRVS